MAERSSRRKLTAKEEGELAVEMRKIVWMLRHQCNEQAAKEVCGTAFKIQYENHNIFLTLKHCFETNGQKYYLSRHHEQTGEIEDFDFEVVETRDDPDIAILRLKKVGGEDINLNFDNGELDVNLPIFMEKVYSVHHPYGISMYTCTKGKVSNPYPTEENPVIRVENLQTSYGSSGAPVFNSNGRIVGLIHNKGEDDDFTLVVPSKKIQEVLASADLVW